METVISASQEAVLACLKSAVGVVDRRGSDPVSGLFLIEKRGAHVSITASNTESQTTSVASIGPARGDTSFAIDARKLVDVMRSIPEGLNVTLRTQGERAVIKAGRSEFKLQTRPGADVLLFAAEAHVGSYTMPQRLLAAQLEQVTYAMAGTHDPRAYLQGTFIRSEQQGMCIAACDSHRLAFVDQVAVQVTGKPGAFVLPRKVALELRRLLGHTDEPVSIGVGRRQVEFRLGDVIVISKLIDGAPPEYRNVIPKAVEVEVVVERKVITESLARMSVMAGGAADGVKLALQPGVLALDLASDNGEAHEQLDVAYEGRDQKFAFNVHYLTSAMAVIPGDTVHLCFSTGGGPLLLRGAAAAGPRHVVMPMRL